MTISQFRVIRGCHVKRVRVQIRFIHLLEIGFLLILQYILKIAKRARVESKIPHSYHPELTVTPVLPPGEARKI